LVGGGRVFSPVTGRTEQMMMVTAAPGTAVDEVMDSNPPVVGSITDQEHAAWQAFQHGEPGLSVVDDEVASSAWSRLSSCWEFCSKSTTRTSLASVATFPPRHPRVRPVSRGCVGDRRCPQSS
jgi:hypothetical protein